jgi:hypothetical protein
VITEVEAENANLLKSHVQIVVKRTLFLSSHEETVQFFAEIVLNLKDKDKVFHPEALSQRKKNRREPTYHWYATAKG